MRKIAPTLLMAAIAAAALADPALALDGGDGGDREPAGGAFFTSYPEQGSTGIQKHGPPRSVDIPRAGYGNVPEAASSLHPAQSRRSRRN